MSWYRQDKEDAKYGYYTDANKWTTFSSSSETVYKGLTGFKDNWSDTHKNYYVYVPFNKTNITKGDYKASSTEGMRNGFRWLEFESPGSMWYYAPSGNRDNAASSN